MEVSFVRKQLTAALERARRNALDRRERVAQIERAYEMFLETVAVPVIRQLAMSLKAERLPFSVSTPSGSVRLSSDSRPHEFIELYLDSTRETPEIIGRITRTRGSRTLTAEPPLKAGASPQAITEEDVLSFFLDALQPWLER